MGANEKFGNCCVLNWSVAMHRIDVFLRYCHQSAVVKVKISKSTMHRLQRRILHTVDTYILSILRQNWEFYNAAAINLCS